MSKPEQATTVPRAQDWIAEALAGTPPILTTEETVKVLRITKQRVYMYARTGRLKAVRTVDKGSGRLLFPRASLEAFLRSLAEVA